MKRSMKKGSRFKVDAFVKSPEEPIFVIPVKTGIQSFQLVLDSGACPGPDPGFAGVTARENFYKAVKVQG